MVQRISHSLSGAVEGVRPEVEVTKEGSRPLRQTNFVTSTSGLNPSTPRLIQRGSDDGDRRMSHVRPGVQLPVDDGQASDVVESTVICEE